MVHCPTLGRCGPARNGWRGVGSCARPAHFVPYCSPPDVDANGQQTGGCQSDQVHGLPPSINRQPGDMGNILVGNDGSVNQVLIMGQGKMSLADPLRSIVGRTVLVCSHQLAPRPVAAAPRCTTTHAHCAAMRCAPLAMPIAVLIPIPTPRRRYTRRWTTAVNLTATRACPKPMASSASPPPLMAAPTWHRRLRCRQSTRSSARLSRPPIRPPTQPSTASQQASPPSPAPPSSRYSSPRGQVWCACKRG